MPFAISHHCHLVYTTTLKPVCAPLRLIGLILSLSSKWYCGKTTVGDGVRVNSAGHHHYGKALAILAYSRREVKRDRYGLLG